MLAALKDRLAAIKKELRKLGKKRFLEKRRCDNHGLTDYMVRSVMATYVLSAYVTDMAENVGKLLHSRLPIKTRRLHPGGMIPIRD